MIVNSTAPKSLNTILREKARCILTALRYAGWALDGSVAWLPMASITDEYAFALADRGWNFYRALAADVAKTPAIGLEESSFFQFFENERIKDVRYLDDLLFLHDPVKRSSSSETRFYLGTYPWGGWTKAECLAGGRPFGCRYDHAEGKNTRDMWGYGRNPWYDPADRYPLQVEWNLMTQLYHSMVEGYRPLTYGSFPGVTLLIRRDGELRAVMGDGHHRLSILSHLGHERVAVRLNWNGIRAVEEVNADQWYYVKQGRCTLERALEIFDAFFLLNGRERIEDLGLASEY